MSELLDIALTAVNAGAEIVRAGYMRPQVRTAKDGIDFATETDLASEKAIVEVLRRHCPEHSIVGEEGGLTGAEGARFKWLVDPLCGTMNFAAGVPLFSVNLALLEDRLPVLGVVAEPLAGEVLVGERGKGAYVAGTGEKLIPSGTSRLLLFDEGNPADKPDAALLGPLAGRVLSSPRFACRSFGTALASAFVARGRMAGALIWRPGAVHWTAGITICREAGCIVREFGGGEWQPGDGHCIIAADQATYEELSALVRG